MIKEIRAHYGISQDRLAAFLKITRSQLSMAEIERRSLPQEAFLTLVSLSQAIHLPASTGKTRKKKDESEDKQEFDLAIARKIVDVEYRLAKAQRQLAKMKTTDANARQILANLPALKLDSKLQGPGFLDHLQHRANQMQKESNAINQVMLETEIEGLTAELAYLKKKKSRS